MVTCRDIMDIMEQIAPASLAEEWDHPGLLVGSPAKEVQRILVVLDVNEASVSYALTKKCDMIISHHPLIFGSIKAIRTDNAMGWKLKNLLDSNIAVFAAHTNLDSAQGGVNDVLAKKIGLIRLRALGEGAIGRIGELDQPLEQDEFAAMVKKRLGLEFVRVVRRHVNAEGLSRRVALCSGSGAEYIPVAAAACADAYVTGDVKYHDAQRAAELGLFVVDAGHFGTEFPIVNALAERLSTELGGLAEVCQDTWSEDFFELS